MSGSESIPGGLGPQTLYGLPEKVVFCKICVISNQRPNSAVEFEHSKESVKKTIGHSVNLNFMSWHLNTRAFQGNIIALFPVQAERIVSFNHTFSSISTDFDRLPSHGHHTNIQNGAGKIFSLGFTQVSTIFLQRQMAKSTVS